MTTAFAAPADDPRTRRPVDAAILTTSVVFVALLAWVHHERDEIDTDVLNLFGDGIPGWLDGVAGVTFAFGGIYAIALTIGIATRRRWTILRDVLVAVGLTLAGLVVGALAGGPEFPDFLPELIEEDGYPSYPVPRLAIIVAVIVATDLSLTVPMRKLGRRIAVGVSIAGLVLVYGTVTAVLGAVALGIGAAAATRLLFGTGRGAPDRERLAVALEDAGVQLSTFDYLEDQPVGATLARGVLDDGRSVTIKVYGRDATDVAFAARAWRSIWYRDSGWSMFASRSQLAEHEVLAMFALNREDAPVPRFISAGKTPSDDIVVISEAIDGTALHELDGADVTDSDLDRTWSAVAALHAIGISHGSIDRSRLVVTDHGVVLDDMSSVHLLADVESLQADHAQLLVATALSVGPERAIAASSRHLDADDLLATLPYLQAAALPGELQRDVRRSDYSVKDIRTALAARLDVAAPELADLRRISLGGAMMVLFTLIAAYSLIAAVTEIGLGTIVDELSRASWGWVALALAISQLPSFGEYISLTGLVGRPIPLGPTVLFRYAMLYISLAVPGDAGAIAMSVRYQQKLGVPPAAAIAQGPLLVITSKLLDIALLLITIRFVTNNIDTGEIDFGPVFQLILLVVGVAVIATIAVIAIPKWRSAVLPHAREGLASVKGVLTEPDRIAKVLAGSLFQKVLFAIALSASVAAYGETLSFPAAILVNTVISIFIGLIPVPGGIGVGEAALSAGLIAVGVPEHAAVAAAITHRILTSYLPPVFGWWAARWLTDNDYL